MKRAARALSRRYGRAHRGERKYCPTGSRVQTLLFPMDRFDIEDAKRWARKHDWKADDVDVPPHGEFIHLRQEDPSHFQRIATVYMGGRGVQARVGWPVC